MWKTSGPARPSYFCLKGNDLLEVQLKKTGLPNEIATKTELTGHILRGAEAA